MTASPGSATHEPADSSTPATSGGLLPAGPTLTLASRRGAKHAVVAVEGPLDYHTAPQLLGHLATEEMEDVPLLVLDLRRVDFCDSSALGAFVHIHRHRADAGRRLVLTGIQPEVRRILQLTRLTSILSLHETVDEALADG
jgi:anti-sigma B factor antagonist